MATYKPESGAGLTVERSFVVQLAGACEGSGLAGRVEHVVSGRAQTFDSVDELVAFFERFLAPAADEEETTEDA